MKFEANNVKTERNLKPGNGEFVEVKRRGRGRENPKVFAAK